MLFHITHQSSLLGAVEIFFDVTNDTSFRHKTMKATIIILIALICFASAVFDYPAARQKLIDLRETHDHYENVLQDRALTESTLSPGPPYGKPISYLFLPVFAGGYNVSEAGEFYEQFIFGAPYTPGDSYRVRYEVADVTGFDNSTGQELVNGTVVIWMYEKFLSSFMDR
jgi:hypothetical protein